MKQSHPHKNLFDKLIKEFNTLADPEIPDGFKEKNLWGKVEILRGFCKGALTACMNQLITQLKEINEFKKLGKDVGKQAKMQADLIGYAAFKSEKFHNASKNLLQGKLENIFNIDNLNTANESIDSIVYKAERDVFAAKRDALEKDLVDGVKSLSFTSRPIPILKDGQDGLKIPEEYKKNPLQKELCRHAFSILRYTDIKKIETLVQRLGEYIENPNTDLGKAVVTEIQKNNFFFATENAVVGKLMTKVEGFIAKDESLKALYDCKQKDGSDGNDSKEYSAYLQDNEDIKNSLTKSLKGAYAQYRSRSMFQVPLTWSLDSACKSVFVATAAIAMIAAIGALVLACNVAWKYCTGSSAMSLISNIGIAQGGAGAEQVITA